MMWKILLPSLNKTWWNRLCAYMHKSPLAELILTEFYIAPVYSVKNILSPWDKKPNDGAALLTYSAQNPFGAYAAKDNTAASGDEASEPMHFCTRVVKRRNAKENIFSRLTMVCLLNLAGMHQAFVAMYYCFWEACCAG